MEVDFKQWEKINFKEIESGDHILALRTSSIDVVSPGSLEGVVGKDNDGCWMISAWKVTATGIHDLSVYRKRPEFVLPNKLGAVITAEDKLGNEVSFVLADSGDTTLPWIADGDDWMSVDEVMDHYNFHTVKFEGVEL